LLLSLNAPIVFGQSYGSTSEYDYEPFVYTYDAIAAWDDNKNEWTDWRKAEVVVSFNYKKTSKVAIFIDDTEPKILVPISKEIKTGVNKHGMKYQQMTYINDSGNKITMLLFDHGDVIFNGEEFTLSFRYSEI
jgi:hypothetical protein